MKKEIDNLIEQLETICAEFDYISDAESNFRLACRISTYPDHVKQGIRGLREMREYLSSLTNWQLEQLREGYLDELD